MGNNFGKKNTKVMKINGETIKLKSPITAWDVIRNYPDHVLLESGTVKRYGIRANPLAPQEQLKPKKVYFLVDLPKLLEEDEPVPRFLSGWQDRLEMSAPPRRWVPDVSIGELGSDSVRIKVRLPKAQMDKLVEESKDEADVAKKIVDLYMPNIGANGGRAPNGDGISMHRQVQLKLALGSIRES